MNPTNAYFFLLPTGLSVWSLILSQTKVPLAMATACDLTIGFDAWQLPSSNSNTLCTDIVLLVELSIQQIPGKI